MFSIVISNHPHFNDVSRVVSVTDIVFDEGKGIIKLGCAVRHFKDDLEWYDLKRSVELLLNNEEQYPIDAQGNTIGDYDAFMLQAEMGQQFSVMVTQGILAVDAKGTINNKCNYHVEVPEVVVPEEIIEE